MSGTGVGPTAPVTPPIPSGEPTLPGLGRPLPSEPKDRFRTRYIAQAYQQPLEFVNSIAAIAGIVFGLVGISFIFYQTVQLRQSTIAATESTRAATEATSAVRESLDSEAYNYILDDLFRIDELFISRPDMRPYFFEKQAWPKDKISVASVTGVAELKLDFIDYFFSQADHLERDKFEFNTWKLYFEDSFRESTVLCEVLKDEQLQYGYEIRKIAKPICVGITLPDPRAARIAYRRFFPDVHKFRTSP